MLVESTLIDSIIVNSELQSLNTVEGFIDKVCEAKGVSEDLYGNILIAVTEAVNNAVIHGNCFDVNKKVFVGASEVDSQTLEFNIKDEGNGFDFNNLPDPTAPENIEKENGRGVFLIKNLSDDLVFEEPGNKLHIYFKYD